MTLEQEGGYPSEDINRKGLAELLRALGQVPQSGIDALIDAGHILTGDTTPDNHLDQTQRIGSNVVRLF